MRLLQIITGKLVYIQTFLKQLDANWDRISKNPIKSCIEMEKIKKIKKFIDFIVDAEQNDLTYETNCPIPCSFREYRTVGDPFIGKNFVFESNDERFQRWQ